MKYKYTGTEASLKKLGFSSASWGFYFGMRPVSFRVGFESGCGSTNFFEPGLWLYSCDEPKYNSQETPNELKEYMIVFSNVTGSLYYDKPKRWHRYALRQLKKKGKVEIVNAANDAKKLEVANYHRKLRIIADNELLKQRCDW